MMRVSSTMSAASAVASMSSSTSSNRFGAIWSGSKRTRYEALAGVEAHQVGGIGRADFGDTGDAALAQRSGQRHPFEEGRQRHLLADLDEQVLVTAEGVAGRG